MTVKELIKILVDLPPKSKIIQKPYRDGLTVIFATKPPTEKFKEIVVEEKDKLLKDLIDVASSDIAQTEYYAFNLLELGCTVTELVEDYGVNEDAVYNALQMSKGRTI